MIPRGLWEDMSMEFITKLPKSKDPVTGITYNLIIVIVDRFTKYLIVVPFKETHTAEQLGHLLLDRLVRDHRVLITIITDRDKLFTSNYWKTISAAMGTKPKMSTAYHPRTDSQTERACHGSGPVAYLAQVTHLAGKFHLHCCLFAPLLPDPLPIRTSPAPPASSLPFSFSSFLVFRLVHQSKSQVSSQVRSRLPNQLGLSSALPLPCHTTKDLPNHNTLHQATFTSLSCLNNQTKPCQLLEMTSSFATCLQSSCEFKLLTLLPSPSLNALLTQRSSVVMAETRKSRMRSLRASSRHCHSR